MSEVRPEVVATVVRALLTFSPDDVADLDALDHVSEAEREAATGLHAELLAASHEVRDERLRELERQAREEPR